MRKLYALSTLVCLVLSGLSIAVPQTDSTTMSRMSQPRVIWIYREDVKPARAVDHVKVEHSFTRLWERAQVQPFLGLDAVTGNANETVFIAGYASFAAFERDYQIFNKVASGPMKDEYEALEREEANLINGVRSTIAAYRPDLSYLGDRFMSELPKARYLQAETFRVRLGKDQEFADGAKLFQEAYKKLDLEDPWLVYQAVSGAPAGTYIMFSQMKSMQELDERMALHAKISSAMGEEKMKEMMKGSGDTFVTIENDIYSLNPHISNVTREFAAADPAFWGLRPAIQAKSVPVE